MPRNLDSRPGVHILPANRVQSISVRRLLWLLNSKPEKMTLLGLVNPYFIGPSIWAVRFALLQPIWASLRPCLVVPSLQTDKQARVEHLHK